MIMSRAWTQKEVQEKFLTHCWKLVNYWAEDNRTPDPREKLQGLMHSFLTLLDGLCDHLPAFEVIPSPHPDDKRFHIEHGDGRYYKPFKLPKGMIAVHGGVILNDIMYTFGREHGFYKDKISELLVQQMVKDLKRLCDPNKKENP
jgi:hypothetical protein